MHKIQRPKVAIFIMSIMILTLTIQPNYSYTNFTDINGHWAKDDIQTAISRGIVTGYADGSFRPDAPVTRAEFAKIMNQGLGLTRTSQTLLTDLNPYQWYYYDASKAVAAGYMRGYDDYTFRGTWNISRQEAAVAYHTLMPFYERTIGLTHFSDDASIALWAKSAAMAVVDKAYMIGDAQGRFRPEDALTRAEACVAVVNFLNGERINPYSQRVEEASDVQSNSIYTGRITIDDHADEGELYLDHIVSLSDVYVETEEETVLVVNNSKIQRLWLDDSSGLSHIRLTGNTTIDQIIVPYGGTIEDDTRTGEGIREIVLRGNKLDDQATYIRAKIDQVILEDQANLRLEAGRIENLMVYSGAKDSMIYQEQATIIGEASVNSPVDFRGLGHIITMHARSNYITYQTEPSNIQHSISLSRPPRFAQDSQKPIPTFMPKDGASGVEVDSPIWITFDEPIFKSNGDVIYNEDIEDIIELRRYRKTGSRVAFTGTIQGDNQTIKIIPEYDLREDENYYIILLDEAIEDRDGNENDKMIAHFKTGEIEEKDWDIDFYPRNNAKNVDRDIEIEIDFNEPIYKAGGGGIRENDLDEYIEVRRGSSRGSKIDFDAYIDDDQEVITIEPTERLDKDTYYYIIILDEVFEDEDYNLLEREWIKFETE